MKKISLSQGKSAIVDDQDFEWLNNYTWCFQHGYAKRNIYINGSYSKKSPKYKVIWMHRLINKTPKGFDTDHIDRNKLNNQRNNLRTVTRSQNKLNVGLSKKNTSGYLGVYFSKVESKWKAQINWNGKRYSLGTFDNKKEAIRCRANAYNNFQAFGLALPTFGPIR